MDMAKLPSGLANAGPLEHPLLSHTCTSFSTHHLFCSSDIVLLAILIMWWSCCFIYWWYLYEERHSPTPLLIVTIISATITAAPLVQLSAKTHEKWSRSPTFPPNVRQWRHQPPPSSSTADPFRHCQPILGHQSQCHCLLYHQYKGDDAIITPNGAWAPDIYLFRIARSNANNNDTHWPQPLMNIASNIHPPRWW